MNILVVEDDSNLSQIIVQALNNEGYQTEACLDGEEAIAYGTTYDYDLIILDRMLPGKNGIEILNFLRTKGIATPVIMVTAMDGINDRIQGLDAGADDYLVKPFDMKELSARVRALLRRPRTQAQTSIREWDGLSLNTSTNSLSWKQEEITISEKETLLLEFFLQHPGETLERERIITKIWGSSAEVTEGNLDNYIYFLRRRLKSLHAPMLIRTIHKKGYILERSTNA